MRNGNKSNPFSLNILFNSSYPTYEEWKHCKIKASNVKLFAVLILPMRNGNTDKNNAISSARKTFLSYLWGMETTSYKVPYAIHSRSYPTYEEWKHEIYAKCRPSRYFVLILPMRNGNTGEPVPTHIPGFGSYPTYEEWKQQNHRGYQRLFCVLILPMRNGN